MAPADRLLKKVLPRLDPLLRRDFLAQLDRVVPLPPWPGRLVLVGHRAAGKSSLLPVVASALRLPGLDLDTQLERAHRRPVGGWVREDPVGFRAAEREAFATLPARAVVAVGGGFLFHHPEALAGDTPVLVPVTFETYCERLRADLSRPRLYPHLPLREELSLVYQQRDAAHREARTVPLVALVRTLLEREEARACSGW